MPMLLALLAVADLLGPPIRQDGYSFRPPRAFHMVHMELFHGGRPLVMGAHTDSLGLLSAALLDGDDENAASLAVAVVDEPFSIGPGARDEFSGRVARHFRERLGLEFALERSDLIEGPTRRVQVVGSVRRASQLRQIVAVAWPGAQRHVVVTCSVPSGRWEALVGVLNQSFDTLKSDAPQVSQAPRTVALVVALLVGALLLASIGLWRRRATTR